MKGILGRKAGMTQIFTQSGRTLPVTVIEVKPNVITKINTIKSDNYNSVQLGYEDKKSARANRPALGHFKKANTSPKYFVKEIRDFEVENVKLGSKIHVDIFKVGELVDVTGTSKGKGFQGAIKRHGNKTGPASHGSKFHRAPGSSGDLAAHVRKNQGMPGQMGNVQRTSQNLEVIEVSKKENYILVKGSIPGPNKGFVVIKNNVKLLKPNVSPEKLLDIKEKNIKVVLLADAAKYQADVNSEMTIEEIEIEISKAKVIYEENQKIREDNEAKAQSLGIREYEKMSDEDLVEAISNTEAALKEHSHDGSDSNKDDKGKE